MIRSFVSGQGSGVRAVVVAHLDIERIAVLEPKADSPLVIDGNGSKALVIPRRGMRAISPRHFQVVEGCRQVDVLEFSNRPLDDFGRRSLCFSFFKEISRPAIGVEIRATL